ncbi:MAG: type II toxin-antitoxin system Phd/YefM family antitoxin [Oscillospiraceae bacterium]|jgi:prevent-host-death family protein|nr:type II toxin-antitoxin system Phd/YefM family antitoxin [Oscillospiraceae bacterium]
MQITATEFKTNFGKYLNLVNREEIHITKNGIDIAVLSPPKPNHSWVDDLIGVIPNASINEKQIKAERLTGKYESID